MGKMSISYFVPFFCEEKTVKFARVYLIINK